MTELETLAARLDQALGSLEAGISHTAPDSATTAAITSLRAENERLSNELATLTAAREKDLAELDTLIAQLRPLVEESA